MSKFILLMCLFSHSVAAEMVVVVNINNPNEVLTKKQIIDIYMGRKSTFPDGKKAVTLDQDFDSPTRADFYQGLVNKTLNQMNAYWARLLFSGRVTPPTMLKDADSVIDMVKNNKSAIGYIDKEQLTEDVKMVARID